MDEFGTEIDRLGWDMITVFGVQPLAGAIRGNCCGILMPWSCDIYWLTRATF
ncbi:hypothetical protein [Methylobacterium sp. JK268]